MIEKLFLLLGIVLILGGCTTDLTDPPRYEGRSLEIGVIGDASSISAGNVSFTNVTFDELEDAGLSAKFDAVIIMKEHLAKAANPEYSAVYKSAGIPFFFMESEKSYVPFTEEELSYEEVPDLSSDLYATGVIQTGNEFKYWDFGLQNDKKTEAHIADVYARIFTTVESLQSGNSSSPEGDI
ncbi:hypothetical protein OIN60_14115 [Paenibacillus sp. P96]|uniref:Lipoprotein n=1 Tax=Paenibacillus zeirhizosphaerae TaxID=2987519 RepID=A0ABT9FT42_9BACL|nr:hypothetical protein [Paenibacillus sp. P96]MDP4097907.1 hypothetical protein [Paenibacillus sp. P96]